MSYVSSNQLGSFHTTTKDATDATADSKTTYKLSDAAAQQTSNDVFYNAPAWTQYKVGRKTDANKKVISSLTNYKDATFTLNKAVTTSREGDTWYQIASSNADLNGAYVAKASIDGGKVVKGETTPTVKDTDVLINLVDSTGKSTGKSVTFTKTGAAKGTTIGYQNVNGVWVLASADQNDIQSKINSALTGTNYTLSQLSAAQISALAQAKTGTAVNLTVNANSDVQQNQIRVNFVDADTNATVGTKTYTNTVNNNYSATQFLQYELDPTHNDALSANDLNNYVTSLYSTYGTNDLTDGDKATNNATITNVNWGNTITIKIKKAQTTSLFNNEPILNIMDSSQVDNSYDPGKNPATANKPSNSLFGQGNTNVRIYQGKSTDANNNATLADLLTKLNNAVATTTAKGYVVTGADVQKALDAAGLSTFYTARYAQGNNAGNGFVTDLNPSTGNNENAYTVQQYKFNPTVFDAYYKNHQAYVTVGSHVNPYLFFDKSADHNVTYNVNNHNFGELF